MSQSQLITKGWLPLKEAILLLKKYGVKATSVQIRNAGIKYNFARHIEGKYHYEYHHVKMNEYFCGNPSEPYFGEVRISTIAKKTNMTVGMVYYILNKYKIEHRKIGHGQGITYVNQEEAIRVIEKHRKDCHGKN